MIPSLRSRHLIALAFGAMLALVVVLVSLAPTADAQPQVATALSFTTPTPTLTASPTPTPTPLPGAPQVTDIGCAPTLTADAESVELLDVVTFTFDDGCECAGDFACDFHPWNATLSSGGVALVDQFSNPPPTTFEATAVTPGLLDVTVNYSGEKQVGSLYFASTLQASTVINVGPLVGPTPTPGPTPPFSPQVVCTPALSASNDAPVIGEAVTFSFTIDCTCPSDPSRTCSFLQYSRDWVHGDGFDFGGVELGQGAQGPIIGIATAAGATEVTVQYYGETWNGESYYWTSQRAAVAVDVQAVDAVAPTPPLTCSADAGVITWDDLGQAKYWVYVATPDNPTYRWLGRTLGGTTFTDPNPVIGATYQIRYAGAPLHYPCTTIAEPVNPRPPFSCTESNGDLEWVDHDQTRYWIYRSVDGGETYTWLGRTFGATTFTDPDPIAGSTYQVHYAGIPRQPCLPSS